MATSYEKLYELRLGDFDRYNRIKPSTVLDIFQDVATIQAEGMGIGHDDMMAKGVFWIVVRTKYRMIAEPSIHDRVIARTWPHSPSRFSFLRDYTLRTESGEVLIESTSEWILMDAETRKFASIMDYYDGPMEFEPERCFPSKARKIATLPGEGAREVEIVPGYTDVDLNGHVNNACYADFAIDALSPGEQGDVGTFQIDYRQEVREGERLAVRCETIDGCPTVAGCASDGTVKFACRIEPRG